jgi:hypothetical protein
MNMDTPLDGLLAAYYRDVLIVLAGRAGGEISPEEVRRRARAALEAGAAITEALATEVPSLLSAAMGDQ